MRNAVLGTIVVHTSKLALLALFIASVYKINLLASGYFMFFVLFCVLNRKQACSFWSTLVLYSAAVILALYIFQIFREDNHQPPDNENDDTISTEELIGFFEIKKSKVDLLDYLPHLLLFLVVVVQYYIFNSDKYREIVYSYDEDVFAAGLSEQQL